jgi:hypothetical protein
MIEASRVGCGLLGVGGFAAYGIAKAHVRELGCASGGACVRFSEPSLGIRHDLAIHCCRVIDKMLGGRNRGISSGWIGDS